MTATRIRRGFTLIELLAVVLIIGLLIGLLASVLQQARNRARRYKAAAETRELAKAWQSYYATYGALPASVTVMDAPAVAILQGSNPRSIKFMDFPSTATANGFTDPFPHSDGFHYYRVSLNANTIQSNSTFKARAYLVNRKAYLYE